jgi:probable rRNA maturation factor
VIYIEVNPSLQTNMAVTDKLERAALETLAHQAVEGDVTLVLTDDAQLQALNSSFLKVDSPTDVLSFPASETDPETGRFYLGDMLISLPCAERQARAAGHALEAELQLLVVHGMLHLLGHDHAGLDEKKRMWTVQAEVLERLDLGTIKVKE